MMSLSQNSQQAGSTDQGDHRNRSPGPPQIRIQAHAIALEHNKIRTFLPQETPTKIPVIKIKSMLNKELLLLLVH